MGARFQKIHLLAALASGLLLTSLKAQPQQQPDIEKLLAAQEKAAAFIKDNKMADAIREYEKVVALAPHVFGAKDPNTALMLYGLALLYRQTGQYAQAEPRLVRNLQILEAALGKDHLDVAARLEDLGLLYEKMGQYGRAEPLLQRSLRIRKARLSKDDPILADSLMALGLLYYDLGQYAQAEPLFQRSLQIRETRLGKEHRDVANSLNNLAMVYQQLGQYAWAKPLFQRSLQICETQLGKDHPEVASNLRNLAGLYESMGQYARAEPLLQRSLQICETKLSKDHPEVATCVNNLASLYQELGEYAKAEPLYQRSLQICEAQLGKDHPHVAISLDNLAMLHAAGERWPAAAEAVHRSRHIVRRHALQVLPLLSESDQLVFLQAKDRYPFHAALSLGLLRRQDDETVLLSASWLLNGKAVAQQTLAQTALQGRDSRDPQLRDLAQRLLQIRQELARHTLAPPTGDPIQQRQRRLDELNQREQDLAKQLRQTGGAAGAATWVELTQVRQALPADAVLIDLARFDLRDFKALKKQKPFQPARYAAWIISATGPVRLIDLGPADTIDAEVQSIRQALRDAPKTIRLKGEVEAETGVRDTLEALAKKVLHPLLPHAGQAKRWILSPDGNLWLVPWAALPLPDGKYAVENHTISYAISGRDLVSDARPSVKPTAPLVLADPDFDLGLDQVALETRRLLRGSEAPSETRSLSKGLRLGAIKRLPGTASEAEAITAKLRAYTGAPPRVHTDKQASTGVFQAARHPKIVVLSTHGYFLPDEAIGPHDPDRRERAGTPAPGLRLENPLLRCGLLLAGCNNAAQAKEGSDNGVLTGLQIVGTDLRGCELVVLSACETGLGDVRNGEGVAGLRQAFQLAGAHSVVATLWQVPDQQSAQLMIGFFDGLAAKQSKAEALRNAQLALIKARRDKTAAAHPFFWAAFTLTGQGHKP